LKEVNVGICGLGTVGGGTFNVLERNAKLITGRTGFNIRVARVATRTPRSDIDLGDIPFSTDVFDVVNDPSIDVVVELIGGYDTALKLVLSAIENGKHVVTANKALIAVHGNEIFKAAAKKNVIVAYEAGVAGGIPVIASGGVTNMTDIERLCDVASQGILGAITGRAIYDGAIDLKEAQAYCDGRD
jgi:homoserine dehydrogenase